MPTPLTLTRFLIEAQRRVPASESFTALVNDVRLACKRISALIGKGALTGQGPQDLGQLAREVFVQTNVWGGQLAGMLSKDCEAPSPIPGEYPRGRYLLVFDPLEDPANLDLNVPLGSLFSVLRCAEGVEKPCAQDFLQPGSAQVCAGYALYGPATLLVLTTGCGVNGFTLDREIGEFLLTHPNMRVPEDSTEIAVHGTASHHWEPAIRRYVNECLAGGSGPRGRDFSLRWASSLVAETHRILTRGGVLLHPWNRRDLAQARQPRLLCEANPIALLIEQAGGRASTGQRASLEVGPESLQQRVSLVAGSRAEVERIERYHRDHNDFEFQAPLFGSRGLFMKQG